MTRTFAALVAAALIGLAAPTRAAATDAPVVVELFTSEGCSSCPPADAFLGRLAKRPGIIALAYHVDYWDYIGWKDPFASRQATLRQRRYTDALGNRYLYTPEMVVDGRADATGSDEAAVDRLIEAGRSGAGKVAIEVAEPTEGHYIVKLPAADYRGTATLWMALFDLQHDTSVARGENAGRDLHEFNIVRELRKVGRWDGKAATVDFAVDMQPSNGCAILLQADNDAGAGQGPILGAALAP